MYTDHHERSRSSRCTAGRFSAGRREIVADHADSRGRPSRKIQNRAGVKQEDSARRRRRRRRRKRRRRRRRRRRVDRATTSSSRPLDGAADDLTLTDSRLLLVASALFISPILPWTLRSSILARTLQHRPALLPFVREIVAERVRRATTLVRPVADHLKCCRAGDSHRDPLRTTLAFNMKRHSRSPRFGTDRLPEIATVAAASTATINRQHQPRFRRPTSLRVRPLVPRVLFTPLPGPFR